MRLGTVAPLWLHPLGGQGWHSSQARPGYRLQTRRRLLPQKAERVSFPMSLARTTWERTERAACLLTLSQSLEAAPGTGRTLGTVLREPLSAAGNQTLREGSLSSRKRAGVGVGGAGGLVGGISRTPGLPLPHPASLRVPPGVAGWPPHSHSPGQGGRAGSPPCLTLSSGREPGWGSWGLS